MFNVRCTDNKQNDKNASSYIDALTSTNTQFYTIDCSKDTIIKGMKGTIVSIPKNSFCLSDGSIVSTKVKIELKEFYNISEMLLSKLSTVSNGLNIETGGMVYLNASKQNEQLNIVVDKNIAIEFASKYDTKMQPFYGEFGSDGNINWDTEIQVKESTKIIFSDTIPYSEKNHLHNVLKTIKLGWINCDKFLNFKETGEIFVNTEGGLDSNIFCSAVLRKYNSIIPGIYTKDRLMKFSPIPLNEEVTLMLISYREEGYFYGLKDIVVKNNETYDVVMSPVSKEELKNKLDEFDKQRPLF